MALRLAGGAHAGGKDTRGYLDLLAEATLAAGDQLDATVAQLRTRRPGDTLVYLTGPGGLADLGRVGTLRAAYPSLIAGAFGTDDGEVPTALDGLQVLSRPPTAPTSPPPGTGSAHGEAAAGRGRAARHAGHGRARARPDLPRRRCCRS